MATAGCQSNRRLSICILYSITNRSHPATALSTGIQLKETLFPPKQNERTIFGFVQVPVLVSDLDIECRLWVKIRLAPLSPYLGTVSLAFVGPPNIKVQLSPYNSVRLMRVPVLQVGTL